MRDILLVSFFIPLLGYGLRHPWIAPMIWTWLSLMNPHRLTYGFAYTLPFAQIAAGLVFLVWLMPQNRKGFPKTSTAWLLIIFYLWCCITSLLSFNDAAPVLDAWIKVTKIQLLLFISLMMWRGRQHIHVLVLVMVASLGFYGVKGGIHTVLKGGSVMIMGPPGSFIENTNDIAIAMMMVIPLMYYLVQQYNDRRLKLLLWMAMVLSMLAVLGTTSRGALLALLTMALLLGLKSRRQVLTVLGMATLLGLMWIFMPEDWRADKATIITHEDHSAQSRLYTWRMIWNMAPDHPIFGGGYNITNNPATWHKYAVTEWLRAYSPHSIYFQALAEHGFVGLGLYLAIGVSTWRRCKKVIREADTPDLLWAAQLCRMVQASLAGFAVGGAFVNLVNYDLPYYFVALAILCDLAVTEARSERARQLKTAAAPVAAPTSPGPRLQST